MNSINRFLLKLLLSPARFYQKSGINTHQLKAILTTKLIMDDRRANSFQRMNQNRREEKKVSNATLGTMLMAFLMGAVFLFSFSINQSFVIQLTFYFSFFIFMLAGILISDFTSVLIDVRDNYILLPKPVNDKTIVLARLLHIMAHISKIVLPMIIPAFIAIIVIKRAGVIWFIPLVGFATLLTIFIINATYLLILKITTPQKFQNIITYFQIFFGIIIYASYQVLPRMLEQAAFAKYNLESKAYIWLLPPYWFAAAWDSLYHPSLTVKTFLSIGLSTIVPLLTIWIVVRFFAVSFNKKLSMINSGSGSTAKKINTQNSIKQKNKTTLLSVVQNVSATGAERAGFLFTWKMMSRTRDFKLKVYPSIGYLFVYLIIIIFSSKRFSFSEISQSANNSKGFFIGAVYFSSFLLFTVLQQINPSEKWKASWIYFVAPVEKPGKLIKGGIKAALVQFFLPAAIIIGAASLLLWGIQIIPNLLLGFTAQIVLALVSSLFFVQKLPFSSDPTLTEKGSAFINGIFLMMISGVAGTVHYFLFEYNWAVLALAMMLAACIYFLLKKIENRSWRELKMSYNN